MTLADFIKEKRPKLSQSSVNTYVSLIRRLYKQVFPKDDEIDTDKLLTHKDEVIEYLKNGLKPKGRATMLAAIVVCTDKDEAYRNMMLKDIKEKEAETDKQELTDKQKANWLTQEAIQERLEELKHESAFIYKKATKTPQDLQRLQSYIILNLYGGQLIAPRRALDFTAMKIHGDIDQNEDNYIDYKNKRFVFNKFKTVRSHGQESLAIPTALMTILKKWIEANPNEYLLIDGKGQGLDSVTLNQRINKIFPDKKNIGVNGFRKVYLTNKFGDTIKVNKELEATMKEMGSSSSVSNSYIKNTDE
jgi:integrase